MSAVHVVVFARTVCLRGGAAKIDFFSPYPRTRPPFSVARHGMAWHGIVVSCRIPPRSAGHPTLPDLVPLRITSPLRPRSASVSAPSALEATSVLHTSSASTTGGSTIIY